MALGRVTVVLEKSGAFEIEGATLCGRFAVHESTKYPDKCHWVITHIKSGMRVSGFYKTLHEAKETAEELDFIGSNLWNFSFRPKDPIVFDQLRREAIAAGVKFTSENLQERIESQNNGVNRARLIAKRFASRREEHMAGMV